MRSTLITFASVLLMLVVFGCVLVISAPICKPTDSGLRVGNIMLVVGC